MKINSFHHHRIIFIDQFVPGISKNNDVTNLIFIISCSISELKCNFVCFFIKILNRKNSKNSQFEYWKVSIGLKKFCIQTASQISHRTLRKRSQHIALFEQKASLAKLNIFRSTKSWDIPSDPFQTYPFDWTVFRNTTCVDVYNPFFRFGSTPIFSLLKLTHVETWKKPTHTYTHTHIHTYTEFKWREAALFYARCVKSFGIPNARNVRVYLPKWKPKKNCFAFSLSSYELCVRVMKVRSRIFRGKFFIFRSFKLFEVCRLGLFFVNFLS